MERTYVMVKPDGVQRGLIGEVVKSLEEKGFKLIAMKMIRLDGGLAGKHYAEHVGKSFYDELIGYITSGPVVAMVWEGRSVVKGVRVLVGATNPLEAAPGSLRGRLATDIQYNLVHASDSPESAEREIALYFTPGELME